VFFGGETRELEIHYWVFLAQKVEQVKAFSGRESLLGTFCGTQEGGIAPIP